MGEKRASKSGATHKFETLSLVVMQHLLRHLGIGQIGIAPTIDGRGLRPPGVREPSEPRVWGI